MILANLLHRFVVVGDTHHYSRGVSSTTIPGVDDRSGPAIEPVGSMDRARLLRDTLVDEQEVNGLDFMFFNGDLASSQDDVTILEFARDMYSPVGIPMKVSYGNHDRVTNEEWENVWGHGINHAFEIGEYAFITINTSDETGSRQLCINDDFLSQKLQEYESKKGVFVFTHIPRYSGVRPDGEYGGGIYDSPECSATLNILESSQNLLGVFQSHFHEHDTVHERNGVTYCFTGHFAHYGLPYHGYRIVEIYDDESVITKQWDVTNSIVKNETELTLFQETPIDPPEEETIVRHKVDYEKTYAKINGVAVEVEKVWIKENGQVLEVSVNGLMK